ncbi:MAG: hypothetical protein ACJASQ_001153 [Crocinitomicaceae bacterium]|jgi:hypothetical protein
MIKKRNTRRNVVASLLMFVAFSGLSQCPLPGSASCFQEKVVNGDFSDPYVAGMFNSDFYSSCTCVESFCLGSEPRDKCMNGYWVDDLWDYDQGNSSGSYMIIDGNNGTNTLVWEQNINFVQGRTYRFTFYVMPSVSNFGNPSGQNLRVNVDGNTILVSPSGGYSAGIFAWNKRCVTFTALANGILPLSIIQDDYTPSGDYGLDHISLEEYLNTPLTIDTTVTACYGEPMPYIGPTAVAGHSYSWTTPSGSANTAQIQTTVAGTYCLDMTNSFGCVSSTCVEVTLSPQIDVAATSVQSCAGYPVNLCVQEFSGGPYTYDWGPGTLSSNCFSTTAPGTSGVVIVNVSNADGCSIDLNMPINVLSTPVVHIDPYNAVCVGDPITLNGTVNGPYQVSWTDPYGNPVTGNPITVYPSVGSTNYTATATNPNTGCSGSDVATVIVYPLTALHISFNETTCDCDPIHLGTMDNHTNQMIWTNGFDPIGNGSFTMTPNIQAIWSAGTTDYYFYPCLHPPGTYLIEYNYTDPTTLCTSTGYGSITTGLPPTVTISGDLEICGGPSGTILTANASPAGTYTYFWWPTSETTQSINVTTPGTYTVTATSAIGCRSSVSETVIDADYWHQYTKNTSNYESANDVITDAAGNVYMVGTFRNSTFLNGGGNPDIQITSSMPNANPNAFVAKYDECGDLIWVANTDFASDCEGTSITIDENSGMLYIAGHVSGNVNFNSAQSSGSLCGSGYSQPLSVMGSHGYVAQYDALTGCLYFAKQLSVNAVTNVNSLTVNEGNGNLFVGGSFELPGSTYEKYAFIYKFAPSTTSGTSNALGSTIWTLMDNTYTQLTYSEVNDMDYDELYHRIHIIGSHRKTCQLFNGVSSSSANSLSTISDAFVAIYNDGGVPTVLLHRAGGAFSSTKMTGAGIAVDPNTGSSFVTGNYSLWIPAPFGLVGSGIVPLMGSGSTKGYMIKFDLNSPNQSWSRYSEATNGVGQTFSKDVVVQDNKAFFLGEFSNSDITATGHGTWPFVGAYGGLWTRVSVIGYKTNGAAMSMNVTQSVSAFGADMHIGNSIESDGYGNSFIAGEFGKRMDYWSGNPSSGVLMMSGSGTNAYVMRMNENNLNFKISNPNNDAGDKDNDEINSKLELKIAPNPTSSIAVVQVQNFDAEAHYELNLTTVDGRFVSDEALIDGRVSLDFSTLDAGIYILHVSNGTESTQVRIVKAQ